MIDSIAVKASWFHHSIIYLTKVWPRYNAAQFVVLCIDQMCLCYKPILFLWSITRGPAHHNLGLLSSLMGNLLFQTKLLGTYIYLGFESKNLLCPSPLYQACLFVTRSVQFSCKTSLWSKQRTFCRSRVVYNCSILIPAIPNYCRASIQFSASFSCPTVVSGSSVQSRKFNRSFSPNFHTISIFFMQKV